MAYNNDIYYNWQSWETRDPNFRDLATDNSNFATDKKSRPIDAPVIKRGYIRPIQLAQVGDRRFFFQYNPNTLVRDSQINSDTYQQQVSSDPNTSGALVDFQFSLLLDRQTEVAQQGNAGMHGVLDDIKVFDAIVGIGQSNPSSATSVAQGTTPGNTILLFPNPVRVLFSALFMVEGRVDHVEVTYQKFNYAMVPIVCTISLAMKIWYMGSAVMSTGIDPNTFAGGAAQNMTTPTTDPSTNGVTQGRYVTPSANGGLHITKGNAI